MAEYVPEELIEKIQRFAVKNAKKETYRSTFQAMEALVHNLNTMHSRAGAQVPFSSINYGTDTSPEGRMVIECILTSGRRRPGQRRNADLPHSYLQGEGRGQLQSGRPQL